MSASMSANLILLRAIPSVFWREKATGLCRLIFAVRNLINPMGNRRNTVALCSCVGETSAQMCFFFNISVTILEEQQLKGPTEIPRQLASIQTSSSFIKSESYICRTASSICLCLFSHSSERRFLNIGISAAAFDFPSCLCFYVLLQN